MKVDLEILRLAPYQAGKPISETKREYNLSRVVKLASNENPLGPSPKAMQAIRDALPTLSLYPDPAAHTLISKLEKLWNFPRAQISLGNGSDELIDQLCRIYLTPGDAILTSVAAFQAYELSAMASRAQVCKTPLTKDFRFDLPAHAEFFLKNPDKKIKLIFLANPNNPTGTFFGKKEWEDFLKAVGNRDDVLIVLDEAYTEFVENKDCISGFDYINQYSNLIVLRTFSKIFGLAGLRLGAMIANPEVTDIYNRVRKPFNINELAQVAAAAAIEDLEFIKKTQRLTAEGLKYFHQELTALNLKFLPSQTNFVLFDTERDAKTVYQKMLEQGVILRLVLNYGFPTCLRLSVGLKDENEFAIAVLKKVLSQYPKEFPPCFV